MKETFIDKHSSTEGGKIHLPCPYHKDTGVKTHIVLKDGYCYRSGDCMIITCKHNRLQYDIEAVLSLVW